MKDIEELMREQFKDEELEAPREVWEAVETRMGKRKAAAKRRRVAAGVCCLAAIATLAVTVAIAKGGDDTVAAATLPSEEIPEVATAEEMPIADNQEAAAEATSRVVAAMPTTRGSVVEEMPVVDEEEAASATVAMTPEPEMADVVEMAVEEEVLAETMPATVRGNNNAAPKESAAGKEEKTKETVYLNIPNIITPNGDGVNDCWVIPDLERYGVTQVQIYSAQRQRVYASSDYRNEFCGDDLPSGNYFYVLTIRAENVVRRGVLVIKR